MTSARRARVLVVGWTPPPTTGMSVATGHLVDGAMQEAFDIRLMDLADPRGIRNMGILDLSNVVQAAAHALHFIWILASWRPQVVYVAVAQNRLGFLRDSLFLVPARLARRAVVIHIHGSQFGRYLRGERRWMQGLIGFALSRARIVVVLGAQLTGIVEGIVAPTAIRVVPNGIEPTPFAPMGEEPLVLWLSNLTESKGLMTTLTAAALLHARSTQARFVFAGLWAGPELQAQARTYVDAHKLGDSVEFVGPVESAADKDLLLRRARAFVLPSKDEGQPYSILEAMRAARPVVTTDVGVIGDMVEDDVNGFLVAPGDAEALANAIEILLADHERAAAMGLAGRRKFEDKFTLDRWRRDMRDVLTEALDPEARG